ncbi:MAG: SseB family protein [Renibacterium sp.]|nr:SseB family protein [Renibacterium sp.]
MSTGQPALPPHIAAALRGAGGTADTAGQPWSGRDLAQPDGARTYHRFDADDGSQDEGFRLAHAALRAGTGTEADVVASLAAARVFVPIVATATELAGSGAEPVPEAADSGHLHGDKESEMALVTVLAPDGRRALPVFSTTENLAAWHPQARPVAVFSPRAALSAVAEAAQLMVLDPGAATTFVVRRPALWALAQQRPWTPSYADAQLHAEVRRLLAEAALEMSARGDRLGGLAATAAEPGFLLGMDLLPGTGIRSTGVDGTVYSGGGTGPELRVVLLLRPGLRSEFLNGFVSLAQEALAGNEIFAERVDSLEVSVQSASSETAMDPEGPHYGS